MLHVGIAQMRKGLTNICYVFFYFPLIQSMASYLCHKTGIIRIDVWGSVIVFHTTIMTLQVSEEVFVMNPPQIQTQFRGNRPKGPVQINARSTSRISGGKHALEGGTWSDAVRLHQTTFLMHCCP